MSSTATVTPDPPGAPAAMRFAQAPGPRLRTAPRSSIGARPSPARPAAAGRYRDTRPRQRVPGHRGPRGHRREQAPRRARRCTCRCRDRRRGRGATARRRASAGRGASRRRCCCTRARELCGRVDAVHELVAAVRQPVERQVLELEVGRRTRRRSRPRFPAGSAGRPGWSRPQRLRVDASPEPRRRTARLVTR